MSLQISTHLLIRILTAKSNEIDRRLIERRTKDIIELARKNKVLLYLIEKLRTLNLDSLIPKTCLKHIERQLKKLELDLKLIGEISEIAKLYDIDFVVVKTIKPFTYVGDDIDILVRESQYKQLIELVKDKLGFKIEGWGPAETTLYKYVEGIKLVIDIHHKLATSTLSYVDTNLVMKSRLTVRIITPLKNEVIEIPVPLPEYSVLITAAHALLKELKINLADILALYYLKSKVSNYLLYKLAVYEGLTNTLKSAYEIVYKTLTFKLNGVLPYRPKLNVILRCYIEKIARALSNNLIEVVEMPLTNVKGYGILLRYLVR